MEPAVPRSNWRKRKPPLQARLGPVARTATTAVPSLPPPPPSSTTQEDPTASAPKVKRQRQPKLNNPNDLPIYSSSHPALGHAPPHLIYATTAQAASQAARDLGTGPLGFDCEWKPQYVKGAPANPIAVVQLCSESLIVVCQVSKMPGALPPEVGAILSNPKILKVGQGVTGDAQKIRSDLGVLFAGGKDLSPMAKQIDASFPAAGGAMGLSRLCERYLHRWLSKPKKLQMCNWESSLTQPQVDYAANDCYVALEIYLALQRLRDATPSLSIASTSQSVPESLEVDTLSNLKVHDRQTPGRGTQHPVHPSLLIGQPTWTTLEQSAEL